MYLQELELEEFRSLRQVSLDIDPAGFRLIGANASGKSSLLEAISMLATTRSPRTTAEREIPNWSSGSDLAVPPYARVRGTFVRNDGPHQMEIGLSYDQSQQRPTKKLIRLDDRATRAVDAVGELQAVRFAPEDVELVSGSPGGRRRYLDVAISQASRGYLRALSRYTRVLEQRNSLLRHFSRERVPPSTHRAAEELAFWDAELTSSAADVLAVRIRAVRVLSDRARLHFESLTGDPTLELAYVPARWGAPEEAPSDGPWQAPSQQIRQSLAAAVTNALASWRAEELRRGVTAVGPHRDDFSVTASGIDLGRFGSRGQQRTALIAVKIAELDLLSAAAGEPPVLLLDDVLSELDGSHRNKVVEMLAAHKAQICVTATDVSDLGSSDLSHLPLLRIQAGRMQSLANDNQSHARDS